MPTAHERDLGDRRAAARRAADRRARVLGRRLRRARARRAAGSRRARGLLRGVRARRSAIPPRRSRGRSSPAASSPTPCAASFATAGARAGSRASPACPARRRVARPPRAGRRAAPARRRSTSRRSSPRPTRTASPTGAEGVRAIQRELVPSCERVVGRIALVDPPPGLDPRGRRWTGARDRASTARPPRPTTRGSRSSTRPAARPSRSRRAATSPGCGRASTTVAARTARRPPRRCSRPTAPAAAADGAQQHHLNRAGLNCLRALARVRSCARGARARCRRDPELRYLHRQRTVGHLVASIAQGTRWAADEPNDERLHESLRATVTAFLNAAWREGALLGDTPAQAFFVRCDAGLNDARARARGEIVVEIGLAVRRPGDFRVLRISHHGSEADPVLA